MKAWSDVLAAIELAVGAAGAECVPVPMTSLDRFEAEYKCSFPPEYRILLSSFGVGLLDLYCVNGGSESIAILGPLYDDSPYDMNAITSAQRTITADDVSPEQADLLRQWIIVARCDSGDVFGVLPPNGGADCPVYYREYLSRKVTRIAASYQVFVGELFTGNAYLDLSLGGKSEIIRREYTPFTGRA
jgi:hypothetical protein